MTGSPPLLAKVQVYVGSGENALLAGEFLLELKRYPISELLVLPDSDCTSQVVCCEVQGFPEPPQGFFDVVSGLRRVHGS